MLGGPMTSATIRDDVLEVRFTTGEKIAGLLRDREIPLAAITGIEVVPDGLAAVRGLRAPGLGLPRLRMIGTWRGRSGRRLVAVKRGVPTLRLRLAGQHYTAALLSVPNAHQLAAELRARIA